MHEPTRPDLNSAFCTIISAGTEITALTYNSHADKLFWTAGPRIWSLSLRSREGDAQLFGEIKTACSIAHMALDWITGNFYFVCKHSRILVCDLHPGDTAMLCSKLITVGVKRITWLALDPNAG